MRAQLALASLALVITGVGSALAPAAASASSYTISRYAGIVNNTSSGATPGPATSTPIGFPGGVAIDSSGNVYVTDDSNTSEVYKITPSGTLSIIAGNGSYGSPTPGPATNSHLYQPSGVAVDSAGNVYIADANNSVIERVTPSGVLSIIAGNGSSGNAVAGPATSTPLGIPTAVAVDANGNLYIADRSNNQVYKVDTSGILSIIGGDGTSSSGGPGGLPLPAVPGPATSSPLDGPAGVAVDPSGDVFVSLTNPAEVVKILPSGNLSVVAGTGTPGMPAEGPATSTDLGSPAGLAVDGGGDVYIADMGYEYVEKMTPDGMLSFVAGDGNQSTPTFGGPATVSALDAPYGIASDPLGRIYFTDSGNYTLDRLVSAAPVNTAVPTVSGTVQPGDTVTATEGAWSNDPVLFSYRWQDCDAAGANCTDITGATSSSYPVSSSDAGRTLRVVVTAQNSGGDASAGSAVTAAVPVPLTTTTPTTTTPTTTTPTTTAPTGTAPPPTVGMDETTGATKTKGQSALLGGIVAAHTSAVSYQFQYGAHLSYGKLTKARTLVVSASPQAVRVRVGRLVPGRVYHYRLMVTDSAGATSYGADKAFRTPRVAPTRVRDHIYHYRELGAPYAFRLHEWLRLPSGLARKVACQTHGYTVIRLVLRGRQIARRRLRLNATCTVNTTFRFSAIQLRTTGHIWFHMRFGGNHQLAGRQALTLGAIYGLGRGGDPAAR